MDGLKLLRRGLWSTTFLSVMIFTASCSDDDPVAPIPDPPLVASGTLGPGGGTIRSADSRLMFTVPAGALATDTGVTITEVDVADIGETAAGLDVIHALTMEPADLVLAIPAILTLVHDLSAAKADDMRRVSLPVAVVAREDLAGGAMIKDLTDLLLHINQDTDQLEAQIVLVRGARDIAYGIPQLPGLDGPAMPLEVGTHRSVPLPVYERDEFALTARFQVSDGLSLESDIRYQARESTRLVTSWEHDAVIDPYNIEQGNAGETNYDLSLPYTAQDQGSAVLNFAVAYTMRADAERIWTDVASRPVTVGDIQVVHDFAALGFAIDQEIVDPGDGGIDFGLYVIGIGAERSVRVYGVPDWQLDDSLVTTGDRGSRFLSLGSTNPAGVLNEDMYYDFGDYWGGFPVGYDNAGIDPATISFLQFGPSGAEIAPWVTEDGGYFGWSQLLELSSTVTDGQPYDGDIGSGGLVYTAFTAGRVQFLEYDTEAQFFGPAGALTSFPGATGSPISAAVKSDFGAVIATDGTPGRVYFHDKVDLSAAAVYLGDLEDAPRQVSIGGGLAAISNNGSNSLSIVHLFNKPPSIVGTVAVGDGPIGIDSKVLDGGNVAVVSAGFGDNTYTVTVLSPAGSVVTNVTYDLPEGATGPGDAEWLPGEGHKIAVTCNTSGHLAIVPSGLE